LPRGRHRAIRPQSTYFEIWRVKTVTSDEFEMWLDTQVGEYLRDAYGGTTDD